MKFLGWFVSLNLLCVSTTFARAGEDTAWKDEAMSALLANAEVVLDAKTLVKSGRPDFTAITHSIVSDTTNPQDGVHTLVESFAFEVVGNFGDAIQSIATLKITQTTHYYRRGYARIFESSLVPYGK